MASELQSASPRDTNAVSSSETFGEGEEVYQATNGLDVEATVDIEGTRAGDADFSEAATVGSVTLASGASDGIHVTAPYERIRSVVTASTTPSSGTVTVYKHEGE